jgi:chemotaxis protein methyltransferase CheR
MSAPGIGQSDLAGVERLVSRRTGLSFPESRRQLSESAIRRSAAKLSIRDMRRYLAVLQKDARAFDHLVAELTVGETYFFREPAQFAFIELEVIPPLGARGGRIRVWSAGCASGEEPYSMAILLRQVGLAGNAWILGTDISEPRLARAREARYSRWSLRGCAPEIVETYFKRAQHGFQLAPAIREAVEFRRLNLADDEYSASGSDIREMDIVLCRNVLIYLDEETVVHVARRLLDSLSDQGWLFLGASDPPLQSLVRCEVKVTEAGVAYRKLHPAGRPSPGSAAEPNVREGDRSGGSHRPEPAPRAWSRPAERRGMERVRASATEPPRSAASRKRAPGRVRADDLAATIAHVRALANRGDLIEAERVCAAAIQRNQTSAELAGLLSILYAETGRSREAAEAARRALYLDRGLIVAHLALGRALYRTGDHQGATRAFTNAADLLARLDPDAVVAASDGERAATLLELARAQIRLLRGSAT